jgi:hypothetical protein
MTNQKYEIKKLTFTDDEYANLVNLFRSEGGNLHYDQVFLKWQYEKNPLGRAVGFNAFNDGELVAHYATIPIECMISGVLTKGLLSINTKTDVMHQGKGLFTQLAEETFAYGREAGFNFVVGVANDNSVYGFTKKLSFQHVCKLETRFLANLKERDGLSTNFYRIWNNETLAWRLANPAKKYFHKSKDGMLSIYGSSRNFNAFIGHLKNVENPKICDRIPWQINPFKLWIGVDSGLDWSRTINIKVPDKFKSVTLNLIFRDLNGSAILNPKDVKFWAMDFDAY